MNKYTIDATNKTLGRVASEAAKSLLGKLSPKFQKNVVFNVPVEIINVSKIKISEKKAANKKYTSYSGYPGGQKIMDINMMVEKYGIKEVVARSVNKMLPKNRLQGRRLKFLKVIE